jgi:basic membrane protein A
MKDLTGDGHYLNARKLGQREYARNVSRGEVGYLPSLEGLVKNTEKIGRAHV